MSHPIPAAPLGSRFFRMSGIDWRTYARLLRIFAEHPRYRLT